MKVFLKWTLTALFFLGGIVLFTLITDAFDTTRIGASLLAVVIGSIALGLIFYLTERVYFPWRKARLQTKLHHLFNSRKISDSVALFHILDWDVLVSIEHHLVMSRTGGNMEQISFHIPQEQVDKKIAKPDFEYVPDHCNGVRTYRIYQTNGLGLRIAKQRIEKKLI